MQYHEVILSIAHQYGKKLMVEVKSMELQGNSFMIVL